MSPLKRAFLFSVLFVGIGIFSSVKAEDSSVRELREELRAMKRQMAKTHAVNLQLQSEVAKLKDASAAGGTGSAEVKVSSRIESFGFDHDPDKHKRTIRIGGGVDTSYQYNIGRPALNTNNGNVRVFDATSDNDFSLNLAQIYFDGTAQEAGQAGFRIDLSWGRDPTNAGFNDADIQQAYIDYIAPIGSGLHMKMGKYVTPIGYEVIEGWNNVNATRSANFSLPIPYVHTGLGFGYNVFENWNVGLHVVNSNQNGTAFGDTNEHKGIIATSGWSPTDWIDWNLNFYVGTEEANTTDINDRDDDDTTFLFNTNIELRPWENWTFALNANWLIVEDGEFNENGNAAARTGGDRDGNGHVYGVSAYAVWNFADNWYLALRGEYLNDQDGVLNTGVVPTGPIAAIGDSGPNNQLYSATATVGWKLADPMEIRFEYRHDHAEQKIFYSDHTNGPTTGPGFAGRTFDTRHTQDTVTLQWVYSF
jgi:hypothetical protein